MKKKIVRFALGGLAALQFMGAAHADSGPPISNVAGKIVHFNYSTGVVHIQLEKGAIWIIQMAPHAKYERNQKPTNSSAFHEGDMVSLGVTSNLAVNPKTAILMVDWGNSAKYVATTVHAPYTTPKGDFATSGGAGSVNNVGGQRPDNTIGILGNGGQLPSGLESSNGTTQSVPNDPKGQTAQGLANNPNAPQAPVTQTPQPGYHPGNTSTRADYRNPMQNANMNPYSTGMPSATGLMGEDDSVGGPPQQSGNMMASAGQPVQIMAVIVQANPGSPAMVVQQVGSKTKMNIMVGPNINVSGLRTGQTVNIIGTSSNGLIEANQIMPVGNP